MTTPTPNYEFHPLADLFPLMEGDEFQKLCNDIHEQGLREPITLHEGKILDGRNRWRAAKTVGLPLTQANLRTLPSGVDAKAFVISANIHRRHLTAEQKRELLAKLIGADPSRAIAKSPSKPRWITRLLALCVKKWRCVGKFPTLRPGPIARAGSKRRPRKEGRKNKSQRTKSINALQEKMIDVLMDFKSIEHAEEYVEKTKARLDGVIEDMRKGLKEAA